MLTLTADEWLKIYAALLCGAAELRKCGHSQHHGDALQLEEIAAKIGINGKIACTQGAAPV